ncbi:MAG: GNAT family N-acetyltransferase [Lachnospiraceae bacterium]|nr:GNAT family N-acetyltransferase [Lachnospiraceae bacterium]MDD7027378.1 GNAT family N-acetyltransferase [Lachnospiraceae bacterium]MDY5701311.1 GNAT family N-acetyltransferase [Lachnospiraceae bacterium]
MNIRPAVKQDIPGLRQLLLQVNLVHHQGRPDIFNYGKGKYDEKQLEELLEDSRRPIFVAVDENNRVLAHAFCLYQQHENDPVLTPVKTLYIDDICVLESCRGQHLGRKMYDYVVDYAREKGFYNITLNVWSLNESAMKFYEACGLKPQKVGMEMLL